MIEVTITRVDYGQGIHRGLRRKIRRQIGRSSARCTTARHPNHETFPLPTQLRQSCTVHALGAQRIDVIQLRELLRCEGFGRAKDHVARVVDHNIQSMAYTVCPAWARARAVRDPKPLDAPVMTIICFITGSPLEVFYG